MHYYLTDDPFPGVLSSADYIKADFIIWSRVGAESSSSFHPVTPFPFEGVTPPSYSVNVQHFFVLNYRLGDSVNILGDSVNIISSNFIISL